MRNSSSFSLYAIERRFGNQWQKVEQTASPHTAKLKARLLAIESPLHAVRIREVVIPTY